MTAAKRKKSAHADEAADLERRIVLATQEGLALCPRPYHRIAEQIGAAPGDVMACMKEMLESGAIRRIAAVPNHYALGFVANGMSVWEVSDEDAASAGAAVGALPFVSHCYLRTRHPPAWPYNLFAMVHGKNRDEVKAKVSEIARLLGPRCRGFDVLYSTKILKKTGLRLRKE